MSSTFYPVSDRILVRRIEPKSKTDGGIILPDQAKEKPKEGVVLRVGPGKRTDHGETVAPRIAEGDRIVFSAYGGQEVVLDGETLLVITEEDILGVVVESESKKKGR